MTITCTKCDTEKPEDQFYANERKKNGKRSHCKKCVYTPKESRLSTDGFFLRCLKCSESKLISDFKIKNNKWGRSTYCTSCDLHRYRTTHLKRYNLTIQLYEKLLYLQNGVCMICDYTPREDEVLHVDHDHSCCPDGGYSCGRCVRGLLCFVCNTGVGKFKDNPETLRKAANYLEFTKIN